MNGYRFVSLRKATFRFFWWQNRSRRGKELYPHLHNLETAECLKSYKNHGFPWFWGFECLIVRQKRYPKGIKNEVEIRLAWLVDFRVIFNCFWIDFGIPNRAKIDEKRSWKAKQKKKQPEQPRKRQWEAPVPRGTRGWSSGEGQGEGVNPSPKGLGKTTYR